MTRCIELAEKARGKTYPNPMVGSVIVHQGKIIGEGYHRKAGETHAEINAINSVQNRSLLPESTIYVSLEPCAHFGKTPPCANTIAEIGFQKVVIGEVDSHEKVNGKGIQILKNAGIEVTAGVLENECRQLNKRFFTFHQKKRPYIVLKWAASADGFIDQDFRTAKISNAPVNQYVHQLRAEEHAILVGTTTALTDNPSLTTRSVPGRNPVRILIDADLKVPLHYNIYNGEGQTIVLNTVKNTEENNIRFLKFDRENFLPSIMDELHRLQIQSVLVEGGAFTLNQMIEVGMWDEAVVIRNPELFLKSGTQEPTINVELQSEISVRNNQIYHFRNPESHV